jgi:selenide,water dikinase
MFEVKLPRLSHGGGWGCKAAPALLQEILWAAKEKLPDAKLLAGTETSDNAAVIGTTKNGESRVAVA